MPAWRTPGRRTGLLVVALLHAAGSAAAGAGHPVAAPWRPSPSAGGPRGSKRAASSILLADWGPCVAHGISPGDRRCRRLVRGGSMGGHLYFYRVWTFTPVQTVIAHPRSTAAMDALVLPAALAGLKLPWVELRESCGRQPNSPSRQPSRHFPPARLSTWGG
jgi:hypothetical protein